jgi:ferredoxin
MLRNIVIIDEDKCNGCGLCIPTCAEGALKIINGKAKLISDRYCDGLGACLGQCPYNAIAIKEREAEQFDKVAVTAHVMQVEQQNKTRETHNINFPLNSVIPQNKSVLCASMQESKRQGPILKQWPIQLALVSPNAPFFDGSDILLVADCVPFAYPNFHTDFLNNNTLLVACPKLDDSQSHLEKLVKIMEHSNVKSITVLHMDVPCCSGLIHMTKQAILNCGKDIPLSEFTIAS